MSNDNEGHTFWDYVGLGNDIGTFVIILLLMALLIGGSAAALDQGLEYDRLSDQLDNGQRQYVYATPTPHSATGQPSRGELMRERARQGREAQYPPWWTGR
jgi:hypothetical protein